MWYEVEFDWNCSNFDPARQYIVCLYYFVEGLWCSYFRWVGLEGAQWQKDIIIKLDKEKKQFKNEILFQKRQAYDMAYKMEEKNIR